MDSTAKKAVKGELERLIDRYDLESVLDTLAEVCHEKAAHVLEVWQDKDLSNDWAIYGMIVDHAETQVLKVKGGSPLPKESGGINWAIAERLAERLKKED